MAVIAKQHALLASFDGLSEAQLTVPGAIGAWSVKKPTRGLRQNRWRRQTIRARRRV